MSVPPIVMSHIGSFGTLGLDNAGATAWSLSNGPSGLQAYAQLQARWLLGVDFSNLGTDASVYDKFGALVATVAGAQGVATATADSFYTLTSLPFVAGPYTWTLTQIGIAGNVMATTTYPGLPSDTNTQPLAIALSPDASLLYYSIYTGDGGSGLVPGDSDVHVYDLVGGTALADLVTKADWGALYLQTTAAGDILVAWYKNDLSDFELDRYAADGTLLFTYDSVFNGSNKASFIAPGPIVSQFYRGLVSSKSIELLDLADGTVEQTYDLSANADVISVFVFTVLGQSAPGVSYPMRCVRRFMLPYDENKWLFINRLEFVMQTGVGLVTGQGSDPKVMVRLSRDGGFTWGPEMLLSVGAIGQYNWRVFTTRLGRARNPVVEVSCSDPVPFYFLECTVEMDAGTS